MRPAFGKYPNIVEYCELLIQDAAKFHLPRNLLVHGRLYGGMAGQDYILLAELDRGSQTFRAKFQEPEIVSLYFEIANLVGRIQFLRDPDDSLGKPQPFSSEEKQLLRDLRLNNR
jgi:hypothetical protein